MQILVRWRSFGPRRARYDYSGAAGDGTYRIYYKACDCAINGFALGGGNELSMACDIRIASEKAKFGQPEVNLGIIPGYGGTQRLPRLVGKGMAKKLIYSAEMIDAEEAYRIGLVDEVVPAEFLMETAEKLARTIMSKGTDFH